MKLVLRRVALFIASICVLLLLWQAQALRQREWKWSSGLKLPPVAAGVSRTLVQRHLREGDHVTVIACFEQMPIEHDASALTVALWDARTEHLLFSKELWTVRATHTGRQYCARVRQGIVDREATYSLDLVSPNDAGTERWDKIDISLLTEPAPDASTKPLLIALFIAVVVSVLAWKQERAPSESTTRASLMLIGGVAVYALAYRATSLMPASVLGLSMRGALLLGVAAAIGWRAYERERAVRGGWLVVGVAIVLVAGAPIFATDALLKLYPPYAQPPLLVVLQNPALRIVAAIVALLSPVAEELFFRAFVQRGIEEHLGPIPAMIGSAALFTGFHLSQVGTEPSAWGPIAVLGLGLAALRAYTGSSKASMLAHALHNAARTLL